jgi:hypothetical protein
LYGDQVYGDNVEELWVLMERNEPRPNDTRGPNVCATQLCRKTERRGRLELARAIWETRSSLKLRVWDLLFGQ